MRSNAVPATILLLMGFALVAGACAKREHIRDDYGVKVRTHFAMQRVHEEAADGSPSGLDSEEAAVIQAGYKRRLAGGEVSTAPESSQVLILDAPRPSKKKK